MDYNLIYQNLLGNRGPEYTSDSYGYDSSHPVWSYTGDSNSIDPYLDALPPHGGYLSPQHQNALLRGSFSAYDPAAHGFSLPYQGNDQDMELYQLGTCSPPQGDVTHFRYMRHMSPPDSTGFAASSTESTTSEYALSPDAIRSPFETPISPHDGDLHRASTAAPFNVACHWNPQPALMTHLPVSMPSIRTPLRMKDLQVTPDPEPEFEDTLMDDRDVLQPKINPEELELSEQLATPTSPADSGLGMSIHDDDTITVKDEEADYGVAENDNDSDFIPGTRRTARGSTGRLNRLNVLSRRLSGTGRNSATKGILGNSRIVKNQKGRRSAPEHSRSKVKAVNRRGLNAAKKLDSGAKSFPCTFHHYGCTSTFASKNEWKRHVASQHLRLGYFRCDLGSCSPDDALSQQRGFNDFNRKDLFTQHCRRMHAPWAGAKKGEEGVSKKEKDNFEKQLEDIRTRCWIDRRKPPSRSSCGFCGQSFVDDEEGKAWDARMEHVGRHFERDAYSLDQEKVDTGLKEWAIEERLILPGRKKGEWWLINHEPAAPGPRTQTNTRRSGRLIVKKEEVESSSESSPAEDSSLDSESDADADGEVEDEQDATSVHKGEDDEEDDDDEDDEDAEGEEE